MSQNFCNLVRFLEYDEDETLQEKLKSSLLDGTLKIDDKVLRLILTSTTLKVGEFRGVIKSGILELSKEILQSEDTKIERAIELLRGFYGFMIRFSEDFEILETSESLIRKIDLFSFPPSLGELENDYISLKRTIEEKIHFLKTHELEELRRRKEEEARDLFRSLFLKKNRSDPQQIVDLFMGKYLSAEQQQQQEGYFNLLVCIETEIHDIFDRNIFVESLVSHKMMKNERSSLYLTHEELNMIEKLLQKEENFVSFCLFCLSVFNDEEEDKNNREIIRTRLVDISRSSSSGEKGDGINGAYVARQIFRLFREKEETLQRKFHEQQILLNSLKSRLSKLEEEEQAENPTTTTTTTTTPFDSKKNLLLLPPKKEKKEFIRNMEEEEKIMESSNNIQKRRNNRKIDEILIEEEEEEETQYFHHQKNFSFEDTDNFQILNISNKIRMEPIPEILPLKNRNNIHIVLSNIHEEVEELAKKNLIPIEDVILIPKERTLEIIMSHPKNVIRFLKKFYDNTTTKKTTTRGKIIIEVVFLPVVVSDCEKDTSQFQVTVVNRMELEYLEFPEYQNMVESELRYHRLCRVFSMFRSSSSEEGVIITDIMSEMKDRVCLTHIQFLSTQCVSNVLKKYGEENSTSHFYIVPYINYSQRRRKKDSSSSEDIEHYINTRRFPECRRYVLNKYCTAFPDHRVLFFTLFIRWVRIKINNKHIMFYRISEEDIKRELFIEIDRLMKNEEIIQNDDEEEQRRKNEFFLNNMSWRQNHLMVTFPGDFTIGERIIQNLDGKVLEFFPTSEKKKKKKKNNNTFLLRPQIHRLKINIDMYMGSRGFSHSLRVELVERVVVVNKNSRRRGQRGRIIDETEDVVLKLGKEDRVKIVNFFRRELNFTDQQQFVVNEYYDQKGNPLLSHHPESLVITFFNVEDLVNSLEHLDLRSVENVGEKYNDHTTAGLYLNLYPVPLLPYFSELERCQFCAVVRHQSSGIGNQVLGMKMMFSKFGLIFGIDPYVEQNCSIIHFAERESAIVTKKQKFLQYKNKNFSVGNLF